MFLYKDQDKIKEFIEDLLLQSESEDLEFKHDKIMSNIAIVTESTDTLFDSYNTVMTVKTNDMVSVLTIVTVVI